MLLQSYLKDVFIKTMSPGMFLFKTIRFKKRMLQPNRTTFYHLNETTF